MRERYQNLSEEIKNKKPKGVRKNPYRFYIVLNIYIYIYIYMLYKFDFFLTCFVIVLGQLRQKTTKFVISEFSIFFLDCPRTVIFPLHFLNRGKRILSSLHHFVKCKN